MVDKSSVPQGVDPNAAPVYKLMRQLGVVNLARRISESVTDRQQPNGFRKVEDSSLKDTDADQDGEAVWSAVSFSAVICCLTKGITVVRSAIVANDGQWSRLHQGA